MIASQLEPGRARQGEATSGFRRFGLLSAAVVLGALLCTACADTAPSPINPSSSSAEQINQLWWILFAMAAVIFLVVVAILMYSAFRAPGQAEAEGRHPFGTALIWVGGVTVPLVVLGTVFLLSTRVLASFGLLSPSRLTIKVTGHQWWWEIRYPQDGVVTANEIHIPTGRQVEVKLTSDDVIHAFWVPELQGKIDAIPGETNTLTLETTKAGTYRGECLVYCGLQHANMNFIVVADSPAQYTAWLAGQQKTPTVSADALLARGQQVFVGAACSYCHAITGTNAAGHVGPDLTHFASRRQIAAGALPNTSSALRGWIVNPQTSKPGNLMPAESLSSSDLDALIAYLESLK